MSIAPGRMMPTSEVTGPKGAPYGDRRGPATLEAPLGQDVTIRAVDILRLQPGDRLLVHAEGQLGIGPGGAGKLASQVRAMLKLDELGFDVPVVVTAPGLRIEVLRPS
jgi:hypothetical protein